MAEILGVVAGAAGLAQLSAQLLSSCVKLRLLYNSYKGAPAFLIDTLDDMENLARLLRILDRDRQRRGGGSASHGIVEQSIGRCQRAVTRIRDMVDELEAVVSKSPFRGKMFTAFNQEHIKSLCDGLERAKSSLMLALEVYRGSCQQEDTDRIIDALDRNNVVFMQQFKSLTVETNSLSKRPLSASDFISQDEAQERASDEPSHKVVRRMQQWEDRIYPKQSSRQQKQWRIRLRPWFTRQVWDISLAAALSGFNINLRTCNFVSSESLIFDACQRGDLGEVQALFRSGLATPFDCSSDYGGVQRSVLSEAALSGSLQLCRCLVDLAGYPVRPNGSRNPIETYSMRPGRASDTADSTDIFRLLLPDPSPPDAGVPGLEIFQFYWWRTCPNPTTARVTLDEFPEIFDGISWEKRVGMAFYRCQTGKDMLNMLPAMLGFPAVNSEVALARDSDGCTCLHTVAYHAGARLKYSPETVFFLRQVLAYGADLHDRNNEGETPLMTFLRTEARRAGPTNFRFWVHLLESAGVNLKDYGRTEYAIRDTLPVSDNGHENIRITKFEFGPNVRDWDIERRWLVEVPIYELVNAPGTWPNNALSRVRTICWDPHHQWEDDGEETGAWEKAGRVFIDCNRNSGVNRPQCLSSRSLFSEIQDDCGSVTRLFETESRKPRPRPRSYSQPARVLLSDRAETHHIRKLRRWFPRCHICVDGQPTLLCFQSIRSCVKGHYGQRRISNPDYHAAIEREMRHFQTRYTSPEDLPSLPYAAYHPVWKKEKRLRKKGGAVTEL